MPRRDPKLSAMEKMTSVTANFRAAEKSLIQLRDNRKKAIVAAVRAGNSKQSVAKAAMTSTTRVLEIMRDAEWEETVT